jgi:hypothetical protein
MHPQVAAFAQANRLRAARMTLATVIASITTVGVLPPARRLKPRATRCEAGLHRRIQAAAAAFARQAAGFSPTACAASRSHTLRSTTVVLCTPADRHDSSCALAGVGAPRALRLPKRPAGEPCRFGRSRLAQRVALLDCTVRADPSGLPAGEPCRFGRSRLAQRVALLDCTVRADPSGLRPAGSPLGHPDGSPDPPPQHPLVPRKRGK